MRRSLYLLPLAFVVALLAGCGNKGPLVRAPAKSAPAATSPPAPATPASASSSAMPATDQP